MHRIIVDEKRWLDEARFLHALNYCMLLPGPEAQQLATYVGWLLHGVRGGLVAGVLFILPGAIAILALSWLYVLLGDLSIVEGLFFGLKAAVLAIVVQALVRIGTPCAQRRAEAGARLAAFVAALRVRPAVPARRARRRASSGTWARAGSPMRTGHGGGCRRRGAPGHGRAALVCLRAVGGTVGRVFGLRRRTRLHRPRHVLLEDGGRHLRRRLRRARLRRAAGRGALRLAACRARCSTGSGSPRRRRVR
jgi:chromate transporter